MKQRVVAPVVPAELIDSDTVYHVNPTGRFVVGGPQGDCGLTGRKIIVDTYGGWGRHGGGAFSGKDPSKVDRSAAYMARYLAKNVVASGAARQCEVQLAYAIGVAQPVSVHVDTFGSGSGEDSALGEQLRDLVDLRPASIIERFELKRPIYRPTASYGHFGREADRRPVSLGSDRSRGTARLTRRVVSGAPIRHRSRARHPGRSRDCRRRAERARFLRR